MIRRTSLFFVSIISLSLLAACSGQQVSVAPTAIHSQQPAEAAGTPKPAVSNPEGGNVITSQ